MRADVPSENSTIVRSNKISATERALRAVEPAIAVRGERPAVIPDDVPRTLALALGLWMAAVAVGTAAGVFQRLPDAVVLALAVFSAAFAVAVVVLDASVRNWLARRLAPLLARAGLERFSPRGPARPPQPSSGGPGNVARRPSCPQCAG